MNKIKMILDCDPGHDDAIAILLAGSSEAIDLLAITTEAGNQTVDKTTRNALNVVQYLNLKVPVFRGCEGPLVRNALICPEIHGESGLDGVDFPEYPQKAEDKHAVNYLTETLMQEEAVTVVTTGAMTNLAMAIKMEPRIVQHIERIVLMGGSMGAGNISPAAEFNILADAEAAHICFECGCPIYMVGLDVTRQCMVLPEVVDRMEKIQNKASDLFCGLMKFFNQTQKEFFGLAGGPLHDPLTVACLLEPSLVTFKKMAVTIDHQRGQSYGRTNCDSVGNTQQVPNAYVAVAVDVEAYWDLIEKSLRAYH